MTLSPKTALLPRMIWTVTCLAGSEKLDLCAEDSALEAAGVGLDEAAATHPHLPREAWLVLTRSRRD